ncbi:MAG: hypothetical protein ACOCQA_02820 [bacterium]
MLMVKLSLMSGLHSFNVMGEAVKDGDLIKNAKGLFKNRKLDHIYENETPKDETVFQTIGFVVKNSFKW